MTGSFPFALFSIIDNFSQCLGQYEQKHYFRDFSPLFKTITMMIIINTDTAFTMGQIPFQVVCNYLI